MEEILSRYGATLVTYKGAMNNFNKNMLLAYNKETDIMQIDETENLCRYIVNTGATVPMPMCTKRLSDYYERTAEAASYQGYGLDGKDWLYSFAG